MTKDEKERKMDKPCFFHTTPKTDCNLCDGYGNPSPVGQRVDVSGCKSQTETKGVMHGDTIAERSHARDCAMQNNSFQSQGKDSNPLIPVAKGENLSNGITDEASLGTEQSSQKQEIKDKIIRDTISLIIYKNVDSDGAITKEALDKILDFVDEHFVRKEEIRKKFRKWEEKYPFVVVQLEEDILGLKGER